MRSSADLLPRGTSEYYKKSNKQLFKVSGHGPKGIQQMGKQLLSKINLVRKVSICGI